MSQPGEMVLRVDGLKESIRFLGKVDKELRKEAVKIVRVNTIKIKNEARRRMAATPGVRRSSYPLKKTAIIHRASGKGAAIGINRTGGDEGAVIFPAEFGMHLAMVPRFKGKGKRGGQRWIPQNSMIRRTFPIWRGNQFVSRGTSGPGWIVQPTIRKWLPVFDKQLAEDLAPIFERAARRAGVPRG